MDSLAEHHYRLAFNNKVLVETGNSYQDFFGEIMNRRYPADFVRTRPWGREGDDKCDGYLRSKRKFYQVYAPERLEKTETLRKMREDFVGAVHSGKDFFDTWVFVHNCKKNDVPTWLIKELENLQNEKIDGKPHGKFLLPFGPTELEQEFFNLDNGDLVAILGPSPDQRAMQSLGFEDIKPVIEYIGAEARESSSQAPRPVPATKLQYNELGDDVEALIRNGLRKANLVEQYLDQNRRKELSGRIFTAFTNKYNELNKGKESPEQIFNSLRTFAQGPFQQSARAEAAVYAVLAYLFERCAIFEEPPEDYYNADPR